MKILYYVAVPKTEDVLNLITLFSIDIRKYGVNENYTGELGLFIYRTCLALESVDRGEEWLLDNNDAIHVLALYANKDFNGMCAYLNSIPDKPFTVHADAAYFNYKI